MARPSFSQGQPLKKPSERGFTFKGNRTCGAPSLSKGQPLQNPSERGVHL
jgi:hypothetical protein